MYGDEGALSLLCLYAFSSFNFIISTIGEERGSAVEPELLPFLPHSNFHIIRNVYASSVESLQFIYQSTADADGTN